jgi:dolichol-phosphate mannosyltransferase
MKREYSSLDPEVSLALGRGGLTSWFSDDASTDETRERINAAQQPIRRPVCDTKYRGQSARSVWNQATPEPLLLRWMEISRNDPADLPKLLTELDRADFILGRRVRRQDSWLRKVSSRVARLARKIVLGVGLQDTGCSLRVFKRSALDGIFPFNGLHRFLPVLVYGGGRKCWKSR